MAVSRRTLLKGGAAVTAAAAVDTIAPNITGATTAPPPASPAVLRPATANTTLPSPEVIALQRMGYGPRYGDIARVQQIGLPAYIAEQLSPDAIDDSLCDQKLTDARLKIKYDAINEARPLSTLLPAPQSATQLWTERVVPANLNFSERVRPADEVRVATWIRAVYSKRQLKELLVDFWHNHFSVNLYSERAISATFPAYDKIMRDNCLGSFRTMLEQVAQSAAMMYSLDNVSNKAGGGEGGNENYSRELFELHTLGSDNYYKFYDDRTKVPRDENGLVRGYIDDDVYEAARCLSGWTIANGHYERPELNDGSFLFDTNWHDGNQKIVLSNDIKRSGGIDDGKKVFDLLAAHPGTARYLCTKLCRRLIADTPPSTVVDSAVAVWLANVNAADQIKLVVQTILTSDAFKTTWGQKVKRPFEAIVSYLRATDAVLPVDEAAPGGNANNGGYWGSLFYQFGLAGHKLFEWPTPTGYPDRASYWVTTNGLLRRWNLPYILTQSWGGGITINLKQITDTAENGVKKTTCTEIVDYWISRLCGFSIDSVARTALIEFLAQGGDVNKAPVAVGGEDPTDPNVLIDRLNSLVQLLSMTPDFQAR